MKKSRSLTIALTVAAVAFVAASAGTHAAIIQTNTNATVAASSSDLLQTNLASASQPAAWKFINGSNAVRNPVAPLLTNGTAIDSSLYGTNNGEFTIGDVGDSVTFVLDTSTNTLGYDITGIDFYHGWRDDGRDRISFLIEVACVADPLTFSTLHTTTAYDPAANYGRQSITEDFSGILASGVNSIRITVASAENSGVGLSEIDVFGSATIPEPASLALLLSGGMLMLARRRRASA